MKKGNTSRKNRKKRSCRQGEVPNWNPNNEIPARKARQLDQKRNGCLKNAFNFDRQKAQNT